MFFVLLAVLVNTSKAETDVLWVIEKPDLLNVNSNKFIKIIGTNTTRKNHLLVLRADDLVNAPYHNRVNVERWVPPGEFTFQIALGALKTPSGRALQWKNITNFLIFQMQPGIELKSATFTEFEKLDEYSFAWDLGAEDSAVFPGFSALTPNYAGMHLYSWDKNASAVDRNFNHGDLLTDDGIKGIKTLKLDVPKGRWYITLWIEEPGYWEYLPHPLERILTVNNKTVWLQKLSPGQWLDQKYLQQVDITKKITSSSWDLFGQVEKLSFSAEITKDFQGLNIQWAGDMPSAGFLSAIVVEPYSDYRVRNKVEAQRQVLWESQWPMEVLDQKVSKPSDSKNSARESIELVRNNLMAAPDTATNIDIQLQIPESTRVSFTPFQKNSLSLDTELRIAQWQVRRTQLNNNALVAEKSHWVAHTGSPLSKGENRVQLRVYIPAGAPPGDYTAYLSLDDERGFKQAKQITLKVLNVSLPVMQKPVGVYHEAAPYWDWFEGLRAMKENAIACDFAFLRKQGLTGIAPPLPTPNNTKSQAHFIRRLQRVSDAGFSEKVLAYAPLKRLVAEQGIEQASKTIAALEQRMVAAGLVPPLWATADEPSNPSQQLLNASGQVTEAKASLWARNLRAFRPGIGLAGQLNNPKDAQLLTAFSTVLINQGFGVSRKAIIKLRARGLQPWYYNMSQTRLAAGFYLWRSTAAGYLQWHARMPTAKPFDPTDGREDDIQLLLPSSEACPAVVSVHQSLWRLSEGIGDYRWMLWLQEQTSPAAKQLLKRIEEAIPLDFTDAEDISDTQLDLWRQQIVQFAISSSSA